MSAICIPRSGESVKKRRRATTTSRAILKSRKYLPLPNDWGMMRFAMIKRTFDIFASALALLLLCPLLLVLALLGRIFLGRPVTFRQHRPGLHARPFRILKFRTMTQVTDAAGDPLPDDRRMTKYGNFLRRSSLDELPELWNVLRGEMSLVGPRPLLAEYLSLYNERQMRRHDVRPGITGWSQVQGRNAVGWDQRLEMDVWYVENHTLLLDLRILFRTVLTVLTGAGVNQEGHATMEKFRGSDR